MRFAGLAYETLGDGQTFSSIPEPPRMSRDIKIAAAAHGRNTTTHKKLF